MAARAEFQRLFIEASPEVEEPQETNSDGSGYLKTHNRGLSALFGVWRAALGAGLVCLGLLAVATRWGTPVRSDVSVFDEDTELAEVFQKPFQQCGGQGYHNSTCCQKGCACVEETAYYSQCKAPEGLDDCDIASARDESGKAVIRKKTKKEQFETAKTNAEQALKKAKEAQAERVKAVKEAREASTEADTKADDLKAVEKEAAEKRKQVQQAAKEELDKTTKEVKATLAEKTQDATALREKKIKAAKDAKAVAEKDAQDKLAAFNEANKVAAAKKEERSKVKVHTDKYEKDEKIRKSKECPGAFKECTKTNCCALGCSCIWDNKYYGQCKGFDGSKECNAKAVVESYKEAAAKMPTLNKDWNRLSNANDTASAALDASNKNLHEVNEKTDNDIKAAKDEFTTSTTVPAAEAKKKLKAAKDEYDAKVAAAKDAEEKKTAAVRAALKEALTAKTTALKVAETKHHTEEAAKKVLVAAKKKLAKKEQEFSSATKAVGSWERAAKGDTCHKSARTEA